MRQAGTVSKYELLGNFVRDHRMKLPGGEAYEPCYRLVR